MVTITTTSTMDWEFIETQKEGRALLSEGYQYLRIRKGFEGSFGDVVSGYVRAEGSAGQRENFSRSTSINMAYYRMPISEYLDAVGHLVTKKY